MSDLCVTCVAYFNDAFQIENSVCCHMNNTVLAADGRLYFALQPYRPWHISLVKAIIMEIV